MLANILSLLLLLALMATPLFGATVTLAWDPKPTGDTRTHVRIYERTGAAAPFAYTLIGTAIEPATTIVLSSVPAGSHTYVARAWNGQSESADSNAVSVVILAVPGTVTNVTISITP